MDIWFKINLQYSYNMLISTLLLKFKTTYCLQVTMLYNLLYYNKKYVNQIKNYMNKNENWR